MSGSAGGAPAPWAAERRATAIPPAAIRAPQATGSLGGRACVRARLRPRRQTRPGRASAHQADDTRHGQGVGSAGKKRRRGAYGMTLRVAGGSIPQCRAVPNDRHPRGGGLHRFVYMHIVSLSSAVLHACSNCISRARAPPARLPLSAIPLRPLRVTPPFLPLATAAAVVVVAQKCIAHELSSIVCASSCRIPPVLQRSISTWPARTPSRPGGAFTSPKAARQQPVKQ